MSIASEAYQHEQLRNWCGELQAQQKAEAERREAEHAADPAWQALWDDPQWQALANEWRRSSKSWDENQDLLCRMHALASAYGLPKPEPDTSDKLSAQIDHWLWIAEKVGKINGTYS